MRVQAWLLSIIGTLAVILALTACTPRAMEEYAQTYLKTYRSLVEDVIPSDYLHYFDFYVDYPYSIVATISSSHGASFEFIPSGSKSFETRTVSADIERAIFVDEKVNAGTAMFLIEGIGTRLSNFQAVTNDGYFLEVSEPGSVLIDKMMVDNVVYPYVIIRGSNREESWTKTVAVADATKYFAQDMLDAWLESEEFRRILAIPELENRARSILQKEDAGEYNRLGGYPEKILDIEELHQAARDLGVPLEFADEIYDFHTKQIEGQKDKPSSWDKYVVPILTGVVVLGIVAIGAYTFRKWKNGKAEVQDAGSKKRRVVGRRHRGRK